MAKRGLFSLADEEFAHFVTEVGKGLDRAEIPYIFVGGTAVQMHSLKRLSQKWGMNISELSKSHRLQDYLRATDDVDLALSEQVYANFAHNDDLGYAKVILTVLEDICGRESFSPSEEHLLEYKLSRPGVKRPVFNVLTDSETSDNQRILLNIGRKASDLRGVDTSFYQKFVDSGETITIPYNSKYSIQGRVISLTPLIATKTANLRPKDLMDVQNLANLIKGSEESVDFKLVEKILGLENRGGVLVPTRSPDYSENYNKLRCLLGNSE